MSNVTPIQKQKLTSTPNSIFFSIITPVFNGEKFLESYFNSLLKQNFNNFEVIVVDDGSTDSSIALIKKYQKVFPQLKLIKQKHQGQGVARNTALKGVTGEYILFIDSDDTLAQPTSLEELHRFITKNYCDVVCFAYQKIYGGIYYKSFKSRIAALKGAPLTSIPDKIKFLNHHKLGAPWNKAYNSNFIKNNNIEFAGGLKFEDAYFFWQVVALADKIMVFDNVIYSYRKHSASVMKTNDKNNLDIIKVYSKIISFLHKESLFIPYYTPLMNRLLSSFIYIFKKTPFKLKKYFFMSIKRFMIVYSISSYVKENQMLSYKSQKILKLLNSRSFFKFYIKCFLL